MSMSMAVNGSDLRKVREWLGVRGPVNGDNYQLAGYLQAVASKTGRRRLAQFRMGSHMLGDMTFRFHRARGSGPLARPAAALTRIVIAFATLACLREQRASLAAHHSSPNCCHPGSTTPLPAKPDVHTASTLTQPLSTFFIVVNRKRSNGKSTVAAFDPQTTQHASTGQPFNAVSYGSTSSPSPSAASTSS